jgi:hypothetical protein
MAGQARAYSGGCHCGQLRYRVNSPVVFANICHCRTCQKASGSGHLPVLGLERATFEITGKSRNFGSLGDSGELVNRHFCPDYGGQVFAFADKYPDAVILFAGTLDDPSLFSTTRHTYAVNS